MTEVSQFTYLSKRSVSETGIPLGLLVFEKFGDAIAISFFLYIVTSSNQGGKLAICKRFHFDNLSSADFPDQELLAWTKTQAQLEYDHHLIESGVKLQSSDLLSEITRESFLLHLIRYKMLGELRNIQSRTLQADIGAEMFKINRSAVPAIVIENLEG